MNRTPGDVGRGLAVALAALGAGASCDDGAAAPSTLLTEPRLLAIAADPPVTTIDGAVELRALVVGADGVELTVPVTWRVCSPWTPVRDPDLDCGPATAVPLPVDDLGRAHLDVAAVLARFGGPAVPVPPAAACTFGSVPVPVLATAVVAGVRLVTRKDVGLAAAARRGPAIAAVTLEDTPAATFTPGASHRLTATPARDLLDLRCTADAAPVPVLEGVQSYFYVTAGALAATSAAVAYRPDGSEAVGSVDFVAPSDVDQVRLWTVMIDGDGGAAWTVRTLDAR